MRTWLRPMVVRTGRSLVAGVLVASFAAMALSLVISQYTQAEAAEGKIPPGQITRKSISGNVAAIASDRSSITVRMKHGDVVVNLDGETVVDVPPETDV